MDDEDDGIDLGLSEEENNFLDDDEDVIDLES